MSVIAARAALDETLAAVSEARRVAPEAPSVRAALAAAWDARCALRRAIDAACRGDDAEVAAAGTAGRCAAIRARQALGDAIAQAYGEAWVAGGRPDGFIPATGYGLVPGYQPVASRSHPG